MGQNYNSPPTELFSARGGVAIDVSGGNQTVAARGVYIGGTGTLVVTMFNGGNLTFEGLVPGVILPIAITRVVQSGTTAAATLKAIALF